MIEHDSLCDYQPEHFDGSILWPERCTCDLLAKVRADEREKAVQRVGEMHGQRRIRSIARVIAAVRGES